MGVDVFRPTHFDECPTCPIANREIQEVLSRARGDQNVVTTAVDVNCYPSHSGIVFMDVDRNGINAGSEVPVTVPELSQKAVSCPHFTQQNP